VPLSYGNETRLDGKAVRYVYWHRPVIDRFMTMKIDKRWVCGSFWLGYVYKDRLHTDILLAYAPNVCTASDSFGCAMQHCSRNNLQMPRRRRRFPSYLYLYTWNIKFRLVLRKNCTVEKKFFKFPNCSTF